MNKTSKVDVKLISGTAEMNAAFSATVDKELNINLLDALYSEHSPIREIEFSINCVIPSFVSVHFARHSSTGQRHFVKTNRDDRGGSSTVDRNTLVLHRMRLNAQHIIDMSRKRLCGKSHSRTVSIWKEILKELFVLMPELEEVCMPQCMYRGGVCYETKSCGISVSYKKAE